MVKSSSAFRFLSFARPDRDRERDLPFIGAECFGRVKGTGSVMLAK